MPRESARVASGPLVGVKVVELGGIGPVPFACMLLADLGAEVLRIDRPPGFDGGAPVDPRFNLLNRSQRSVAMDLKSPKAVETVLKLVSRTNVFIEGFRPGVAEKLGLGPDECFAANPALIYGRMTGWGQEGPLSQAPGHDINYISLTGVLDSVGVEGGPPTIPLNLVGDFGGGSLYLALGVVAALLETQTSGVGQVIDAAMVDGTASLMTMMFGLREAGYWFDHRGTNRLDSGAPYYNVYETSDGLWLSIGANETRFWNNILELLAIDADEFPSQHDRQHWSAMKERFASIFRTRTREEWLALADGHEVCIAPVLSLADAPAHPHIKARGTFVEVEGIVQPSPAPRFSRTPGVIQGPPPVPGEHTDEVLIEWGIEPREIAELHAAGAITQLIQ